MPTPNTAGWCPFVNVDHKSPNFWSGYHTRKSVVLHIAQGPYEGSRGWLTNPDSGVSSHFIISEAGEISQMVSVLDSSWANGLWWDSAYKRWRAPRLDQAHAPFVTPLWPDIIAGVNPNRYTISIEHAGWSGKPVPSAQIDASVRLLRWLAEQFHWTYTPGHTLIRHADVDPLDKAFCPGVSFNLAQIAGRANASERVIRRYVAAFDTPIFESRIPNTVALAGAALIHVGDAIEADDLTNGFLHLRDQRGFVPAGCFREVV
jgi:N-acetyl-anhydromuramyl-L-alanine amidase AmpD